MSGDVNMDMLRAQQQASAAMSAPKNHDGILSVFGLRDTNMQAGSFKALSPFAALDKPITGALAQAFTLAGKGAGIPGLTKIAQQLKECLVRDLPDSAQLTGGIGDNPLANNSIADQPLQAANISNAEIGQMPLQRFEVADAPVQRGAAIG